MVVRFCVFKEPIYLDLLALCRVQETLEGKNPSNLDPPQGRTPIWILETYLFLDTSGSWGCTGKRAQCS